VEGQYVCAMPQQAIHQVLQHRRAAAGDRSVAVQSLAVDDPHAAHPVLAGVAQESAQQLLGLARIGPVQVQFLLDCDLAPFQALQHTRRQLLAAIGEGIARLQGSADELSACLNSSRACASSRSAIRARGLGRGAVGGGAVSRMRRTGPIAVRNSSASSSSRSSAMRQA
jgi:hypothetical protein